MDSILIEKAKNKLGISTAKLERITKAPKNTYQNVRYGRCNIPKKFKPLIIDIIMKQDESKIDNWNTSTTQILKGKLPKHIRILVDYCKSKNLKTIDLIEFHKRFNP